MINVGSTEVKVYNAVSRTLVSACSKRLRCLAISQRCVSCGLTGSRFYVEKHHESDGKFHLNLYAIDSSNNEVLMTRDHIVALADGGEDTMENSQTMCAPCNERKGSLKHRTDHPKKFFRTEGDLLAALE